MIMAYQEVLFERKGNIARVTLNRPERMNALGMVMREELKQVLTEIDADKSIRAVVITGTGKAFCAGGDITTMDGIQPSAGLDRLRNVQKIVRLMIGMEKPIIAAVNGVAVGAGCNIALACDLIIASEKAKFSETFVNIGLIPDLGGLYTLPIRVGVARAKELMLTGRMIEAKEAEAIGMVNRVVAPEMLQQTVDELAAKLANGPTRAYTMIKKSLNLWPMSFEAFLEMEANMQSVAFQTRDFDEGRKAFLEKRKPVFTGG